MSDDNKFDDQFFDDEDAAFEEEFGELDIDEEESLEDEFSDEYDDDEWGDGEEAEGEFDGADLVADKKKGLPGGLDFNKIVIIGALLVGGGVMAFQVMTSKPQVVNNVFRSSVNMQGASDGVVFGDNQVETVEIKAEPMEQGQDTIPGILEDPSQIEKIATTIKEAPPMPTSIVAETTNDEEILLQKNFDQNAQLKSDFMGEDSQAAGEAVSSESISVQDTAVNAAEEGEQVAEGLGDPVADDVETITPIAEAALEGTVQEEAASQDILAAEETLPSIDIMAQGQELAVTDEVPMAETQTEPVMEEEAIVTQEETMPMDNSALTKITDRLQTIETQIEGIETKLDQKPAQPENEDIQKLNETVAALQKEIQRLKSEARKPTSKAGSSAKKTASAAKKVVKTSAPQWELRAAQPGKAWVSQKGKSDLQPVVVGDILSGIGRIQSISYTQGKWVVQATSGQIRQ